MNAGAVLRVGQARGFLMEADGSPGRLIVTAAHCLPKLPPAHPFSYLRERTFKNLVGPLKGRPSVGAECLFVDPVADIAVLGRPDDQALPDQADAYDALVGKRMPILLARDLPLLKPWEQGEGEVAGVAAQVLSLDGQWTACRVTLGDSLTLPGGVVAPGMSGSPVCVEEGAVGVVSIGSLEPSLGAFGQPRLSEALPGWLLRTLR